MVRVGICALHACTVHITHFDITQGRRQAQKEEINLKDKTEKKLRKEILMSKKKKKTTEKELVRQT